MNNIKNYAILVRKELIQIRLKIMYIKYPGIKIENKNSAKIRGYFGNKFIDDVALHNHLGESFLYSYPLVQYKILNGNPLILGIQDGISTLHNAIMNTNEITLGNEMYKCNDIDIKLETKELGISNKINKYIFLTPWVCLNQKNYNKYKSLNNEEKNLFLEKILIGNILSMCKGLNINVDKKIIANLNVREIYSDFKNNKMISFYGEFYINFNIPNYFGIGKSVSRGFGVIKQVKEIK